MNGEVLDCDLLVVGAGMAGLSAAGWAAQRGARVVVVEKGDAIGGSAVLSGGVLWTATSPQRMALYGGGDAALGRAICQRYPEAVQWLRTRGVDLSPAMPVLHGRGYQIDIVGHLRGCVDLVEAAGGHVVFETTTTDLLRDAQGRVVGGRTRHADGQVDVRAPWTLLATGGFQGSEELRAEYVHPNARRMLLRSNAHSQGDGLRLGRQAGGEVRGANRNFYGHLVSKPRAWGEKRFFTALTQYHSEHALLFDDSGRRFCDETQGDHSNANRTLALVNPRALCVWDARVHAAYATKGVVASSVTMDKFATAMENGGEGVMATQLSELAVFADAHGFDGAQVVRTLADYNAHARGGWESLEPARAESCLPLDLAPFYALVVYPAITFPFGGLTIDRDARVLRNDGSAVPGLLAAGGDAAGAFGEGYAGGLALAMTFGIAAAKTAGFSG